ncbi:MAG TPA: DUF480 domain-containing protein [Pirellulales bacterium]|jgi:hypothetical protein
MSSTNTDSASTAPRWQPIAAIDRRVLGVLAEKAKTTPDTYPLSLNGLVTGCNQKNNRHPLTQYESDQVEMSLDRLRALGAVAAVQGSGRVGKYRHYLYEWLGVDKVELAVMAELLLRGAQTEGELRGRAARMDPIPDLSALRGIMDSLRSKGLVQSLTPDGRGQIVSHALYLPEEMDKVRRQIGDHSGPPPGEPAHAEGASPRSIAAPTPRSESSQVAQGHAAVAAATVGHRSSAGDTELAALRREVDELRSSVAQLRSDLADLASRSQTNSDELDRLRQVLGE